MNLFYTIIEDRSIIGIGPLNLQKDGVSPVLHWYSFVLHTKARGIEFCSARVTTFGQVRPEQHEALKAYRETYLMHRYQIALLLGESFEETKLDYRNVIGDIDGLIATFRATLARAEFADQVREQITEHLERIDKTLIEIKTIVAV